GIENRLASALFAMPGVKGVEFGAGFAAADMTGSQHNDPFRWENGQVVSDTNHAGGILGGLTTGMPLVFRVAVKPTPSIARPQDTVDLVKGENAALSVPGRHDPCIVPRAVPVVEALAAIALTDLLLEEKGYGTY
ncbi:MAG: chorismate synthase, partial [Clostridia bacterium]|nr:chorismate synthase [Clostridia bacterium]